MAPSDRYGGKCFYCSNEFIVRSPKNEELDEALEGCILFIKKFIPDFEISDFDPEDDDNWEIVRFLWRGIEPIEPIWTRGPGIPRRAFCPRCGWWLNAIWWPNLTSIHTSAGAIRDFDINDSNLTIPEVRSHLSKNFSDIYSLSPRKFEEAVGDVYREMGWSVELTAQSRDGGIDLFCLKNKSEVCIVECKRYSEHNKVGIGVVDRLIGVSFRIGAGEAHIVTSSSFTGPAMGAASDAEAKGLSMNLVDAHELLTIIDSYSDRTLTVNELRSIFSDT